MYFALSSVSVLFVLTTFVQSAPTASLDAATLLNNAQEAQQLNAQFQSANISATSPCSNGDTVCVKNAIATCVNGQFDVSNGRCPATQHCFALPSVKSNGTVIACTSERSAQSLISAAGATGDVTGSGSGGSASSINLPSSSPTLNGSVPAATAVETPASSMGADCYSTITPTSIPTTAASESVVTVTITLLPSVPTTLPPVTQTLSPDQASSALASLLAQGGSVATATPDYSSEPASTYATDIPSPAPSSANTTAAIANVGSSASSGDGYGGYDGY